MTEKEILIKAIEKAGKNGMSGGKEAIGYVERNFLHLTPDIAIRAVVFDHAFAKGFWGEEPAWIDTGLKERVKGKRYQFELQQMALGENPIQYVAKFL